MVKSNPVLDSSLRSRMTAREEIAKRSVWACMYTRGSSASYFVPLQATGQDDV
jgi:hypothetical protein